MSTLPEVPDFAFLRKQAKELLRGFHLHLPAAVERLRAVSSEPLLSHAQLCLAREYGFRSWTELKHYVEWKNAEATQQDELLTWLRYVYGQGYDNPQPAIALRIWQERAELWSPDAYAAAAAGDENLLRRVIRSDAAWVNRPGGLLRMPPLVAVTHSGLLQLPEQGERLVRCALLLLDNGADPNSSWISPDFPGCPLSALYGAAGKNRHAGMTRLLLERSANPDDNESLYHSVESPDITCTRLLIEAGAQVKGTNALNRALDFDRLEPVRLLLSQRADPNELGSSLFHALKRGRALAFIRLLVEAGANIQTVGSNGLTPYRAAMLYGLSDIAELLQTPTGSSLSKQEEFIAACARADRGAVGQLLADEPGLLTGLSESQLRLLPDFAAHNNQQAIEVMLEAGWPIAVHGGDWNASALNHAVFSGNSALTRLLLRHGASWQERHGFNDNVMGTLAFASRNQPPEEQIGDWLGCAKELIAHGMPLPASEYTYSDELSAYFDSLRNPC